jgi:glycerol 2-dehydrogenase (NADP+)
VKLTEDEMSSISAAHKKPGMHRSLLAPVSDDGTIFGWTYEQLGWNMAADGEVIAE